MKKLHWHITIIGITTIKAMHYIKVMWKQLIQGTQMTLTYQKALYITCCFCYIWLFQKKIENHDLLKSKHHLHYAFCLPVLYQSNLNRKEGKGSHNIPQFKIWDFEYFFILLIHIFCCCLPGQAMCDSLYLDLKNILWESLHDFYHHCLRT